MDFDHGNRICDGTKSTENFVSKPLPQEEDEISQESGNGMDLSQIDWSSNAPKFPESHNNLLWGAEDSQHKSNSGKIKTLGKKFRYHKNAPYQKEMSDFRAKLLLEAVSVNNTEKVLELLKKGASPNSSDSQKRSALHISTTRNYKDVVKILLHHGANPNQTDSIGNTPLHLASCTRHLEIVTLLIKHGASTLVTDRNGLHPLAIAYSKLKHCEKFRPKTMTNEELSNYHDTIVSIYNLILHHFDIQRSEAEYNDFKEMEDRFKGLNTKEEIDQEVLSLLESLENFTMKK